MSQVFGDPKRLVNDYMAGSHAIGINRNRCLYSRWTPPPGAVLHLRCSIKGGLLSNSNSRYSGRSGLQSPSALRLALPSVSVPPAFFSTHRLRHGLVAPKKLLQARR